MKDIYVRRNGKPVETFRVNTNDEWAKFVIDFNNDHEDAGDYEILMNDMDMNPTDKDHGVAFIDENGEWTIKTIDGREWHIDNNGNVSGPPLD